MDLDVFTVPDDPHEGGGQEVFDPVNAWPDASSRIYVSTHRSGEFGVYQYGFDPVTGQGWFRSLPEPGAVWSEWVTSGSPPAPVVIASLVPNSMVLGGPEAELAVVGSGFTEASVIVFNGGDERTTFVDPTRVTTIIKPELVGQPITVPVHVRNHMRVSNIVDFTFTEE